MAEIRGRKPKPTEVKIREGNPGKRPIPQPVIVGGRADVAQMTVPSGLQVEGKKLWNEVVPYLAEVGMLDIVDRTALELMCVQYDRITQARRKIKREGVMIRGSTHNTVQHPGLAIEREATRLFMSIAEQFGLTPVARSRLGLAEVHRRSLESELERDIGKPVLTPVADSSALNNHIEEAEVVE